MTVVLTLGPLTTISLLYFTTPAMTMVTSLPVEEIILVDYPVKPKQSQFSAQCVVNEINPRSLRVHFHCSFW